MKVLQFPDPILLQIAEEFIVHDEDHLQKLKDFQEQIQKDFKHRALGLAAPQVGISLRLMWCKNIGILLNPKVVEISKTSIETIESCLSVEGKEFKVLRPNWAKVFFLDHNFKKQRKIFGDEAGIQFFHEFDHLSGICLSNNPFAKVL